MWNPPGTGIRQPGGGRLRQDHQGAASKIIHAAGPAFGEVRAVLHSMHSIELMEADPISFRDGDSSRSGFWVTLLEAFGADPRLIGSPYRDSPLVPISLINGCKACSSGIMGGPHTGTGEE